MVSSGGRAAKSQNAVSAPGQPAQSSRPPAEVSAPGPAASEEDEVRLTQILSAFREHLEKKSMMKSAKDRELNVKCLSWLFKTHARSFSCMGSNTEFLHFIEKSAQNDDFSKRAVTALKHFRSYWSDCHSKRLFTAVASAAAEGADSSMRTTDTESGRSADQQPSKRKRVSDSAAKKQGGKQGAACEPQTSKQVEQTAAKRKESQDASSETSAKVQHGTDEHGEFGPRKRGRPPKTKIDIATAMPETDVDAEKEPPPEKQQADEPKNESQLPRRKHTKKTADPNYSPTKPSSTNSLGPETAEPVELCPKMEPAAPKTNHLAVAFAAAKASAGAGIAQRSIEFGTRSEAELRQRRAELLEELSMVDRALENLKLSANAVVAGAGDEDKDATGVEIVHVTQAPSDGPCKSATDGPKSRLVSGPIRHQKWIKSVSILYKQHEPKRCQRVPRCERKRHAHQHAAMLGVFRKKFIASGLNDSVLESLRKFRWGKQMLKSWEEMAQEEAQRTKRESLADDAVEAEETADGESLRGSRQERGNESCSQEATQAGSEERQDRTRIRANVEKLARFVERWPSRKPGDPVKGKLEAQEVADAKQEQKDEFLLKSYRARFMQGSLAKAEVDALLRLPDSWALDMLLQWQAQLNSKMKQIADAHPDGLPAEVSLRPSATEALTVRWLREFKFRAASHQGLSEHIADELSSWVPWGAAALDEWNAEREQKREAERDRVAKTAGPHVMQRLQALVAKYSEGPPKRREYVCSEAEQEEQKEVSLLDRCARLHFMDQLEAEPVKALAEACTWFRDLVQQWEKNKAESVDPEDQLITQRLAVIAQRYPTVPPHQGGGLERDRWSWPHEKRIRHVDAWYLSELKKRFLHKGLSEEVKAALKAIPVWGAPRLAEWELIKDTRASALFKGNRRNRKRKADNIQEHDGEGGADVSGARLYADNLRDDDRLFCSGKEPKQHSARVRVMKCHGKTVADALLTVRNGVMKLTRRVIADDIRKEFLRVEASEAADANGPATPCRNNIRKSLLASGRKKKREESFRGLTGEVVTLEKGADSKASKPKVLPDLIAVSPSEIDEFTPEEISHYEKKLGWKAVRSVAERIEKLDQVMQTNTVFDIKRSAGGADAEAPPKSFKELSAYERHNLTAEELRHFEQCALLEAEIPMTERRQRLRDHIRSMLAEAAKTAPKKEQFFMKQWASKGSAVTAAAQVESNVEQPSASASGSCERGQQSQGDDDIATANKSKADGAEAPECDTTPTHALAAGTPENVVVTENTADADQKDNAEGVAIAKDENDTACAAVGNVAAAAEEAPATDVDVTAEKKDTVDIAMQEDGNCEPDAVKPVAATVATEQRTTEEGADDETAAAEDIE